MLWPVDMGDKESIKPNCSCNQHHRNQNTATIQYTLESVCAVSCQWVTMLMARVCVEWISKEHSIPTPGLGRSCPSHGTSGYNKMDALCMRTRWNGNQVTLPKQPGEAWLLRGWLPENVLEWTTVLWASFRLTQHAWGVRSNYIKDLLCMGKNQPHAAIVGVLPLPKGQSVFLFSCFLSWVGLQCLLIHCVQVCTCMSWVQYVLWLPEFSDKLEDVWSPDRWSRSPYILMWTLRLAVLVVGLVLCLPPYSLYLALWLC